MGKANSKMKKKNRTQSMAWNFRFPSMTSISIRRKVDASVPHMDIQQWLSILNLTQYQQLFRNFSGVEDVARYTVQDLRDLGIKNELHCTKMAKSLAALRIKRERRIGTNGITRPAEEAILGQCPRTGLNTNSKTIQRHSVAVDSTVLINQKPTESDILTIKNFNQSKSLCNIKMEAVGPEVGSDPVQLKKMLEWELSLDTRDLRSHAWYHGAIPRSRAEEIVGEHDGDFLVRDCTSQPGNYVLSCRSKGQKLHFVINKIVLQPDTVYERVQYRFEEDAYDTVPDLITYYVGSGKALTSASGAKIQTPRNRLYPLSFYANKYQLHHQRSNSSTRTNSPILSTLAAQSPSHSPPLPKKEHKLHKGLSLLSSDIFTTPDVQTPTGSCEHQKTFTSLPRRSSKIENGLVKIPKPQESAELELPPPKPNRTSVYVECSVSHNSLKKNSFYLASGSDSGNGSGDSIQSSATCDDAATFRRSSGVVIQNPKYLNKVSGSLKPVICDTFGGTPIPSTILLPSIFDLENFQTLLLPMGENKPLDSSALQGIHMLLEDSGSRILANHLTRVDLELILSDRFKDSDSDEFVMPYGCGMEQCLLPHGSNIRLDLVERTECVKLLVAITILTCGLESERAEVLNKWIEVAIDTKTALGNLFGFCSIMMGLSMPQIQRLHATWHILRQKYTDSAFNFEAKLRPILKNMNEGTNPLAPNTTIPHLLPLIFLYEMSFDDITGDTHNTGAPVYWENTSPDLGLSTIHTHLDSARQYCQLLSTFRRNSEIVLSDSKIDDLLMDMFRTEFHLKFLWGSRGAMVGSTERYMKFEEVLNVMSEKCEPFSNMHCANGVDSGLKPATCVTAV